LKSATRSAGSPNEEDEEWQSLGGLTGRCGFAGALALVSVSVPVAAQEVTVLCNFEVDGARR
jgi:hypothetical protein